MLPAAACSDKERARGDREVWECHGNAVGILEDVGMKVYGDMHKAQLAVNCTCCGPSSLPVEAQ